MSLAGTSIPLSVFRLKPILCAASLLLTSLTAWTASINGVEYTPLNDIAGRLGMDLQWVEKGKTAELTSEWTSLRFEIHQRDMLLNGRRVILGFPVAEVRGRLLISESDYLHQLQPILTPQVFGRPGKVRHIMIDAGHGGDDPGAQNNKLGLREKSLTLDLAKRLKKRLEARGFVVSMARDSDRFVSLEERAQLANRSGADIFLSLHFNSVVKPDVYGVETFAFTPKDQPSSSRADLVNSDRRSYPGNQNDPWNTLLGYYIQQELAKTFPVPDRGLKRARFVVLRELEIPGVLVEGGFLSHATEGRNIGSAEYRGRIAAAIEEAVLIFQKTTTRLSGQNK